MTCSPCCSECPNAICVFFSWTCYTDNNDNPFIVFSINGVDMNSQPAGGAFPFALSFTGGSWGTPVYHVSRNGNGYTVDTVGGANEAGTLQITGTAEIREQGGGKFISFEYFIDYTDTCDGGLTFTYSPGDPIQAAPGNTNASWESPICYYD